MTSDERVKHNQRIEALVKGSGPGFAIVADPEGNVGEDRDDDEFPWRYVVAEHGMPILECSRGGTGDCWNIEKFGWNELEYEPVTWHICDLDDFISALVALRESKAHKRNVAYWA